MRWKSHDGKDRPLEYCEMAGFLFAVACAPELVRPTEWLPAVLGGEWEGFGAPHDVQRVLDLVTALYNRINLQVLERTPALPAGVTLRAEAMRNFGPEAPLGRWASGYADGQSWLEETWSRYRPAKPKGCPMRCASWRNWAADWTRRGARRRYLIADARAA